MARPCGPAEAAFPRKTPALAIGYAGVKRNDVVGPGVFANEHFAFLAATFRMNRKQHTILIDVDQESPQFEIIAQCFMQQAASLQDLGVIHSALTSETAWPFDRRGIVKRPELLGRP